MDGFGTYWKLVFTRAWMATTSSSAWRLANVTRKLLIAGGAIAVLFWSGALSADKMNLIAATVIVTIAVFVGELLLNIVRAPYWIYKEGPRIDVNKTDSKTIKADLANFHVALEVLGNLCRTPRPSEDLKKESDELFARIDAYIKVNLDPHYLPLYNSDVGLTVPETKRTGWQTPYHRKLWGRIHRRILRIREIIAEV